VIEILGFLVRFWQLRARQASRGEPLTSAEQLELLSLMQLVGTDLKVPPPGACARPVNAIVAQLVGEGRTVTVDVRYVSAAALVVGCAVSLVPHELVVLRAADAVSGVEYVLPCAVEWVFGSRPGVVALVVDGVPTRAELVAPLEARAAAAAPAYAARLASRRAG
jgi:hypothetical protein